MNSFPALYLVGVIATALGWTPQSPETTAQKPQAVACSTEAKAAVEQANVWIGNLTSDEQKAFQQIRTSLHAAPTDKVYVAYPIPPKTSELDLYGEAFKAMAREGSYFLLDITPEYLETIGIVKWAFGPNFHQARSYFYQQIDEKGGADAVLCMLQENSFSKIGHEVWSEDPEVRVRARIITVFNTLPPLKIFFGGAFLNGPTRFALKPILAEERLAFVNAPAIIIQSSVALAKDEVATTLMTAPWQLNTAVNTTNHENWGKLKKVRQGDGIEVELNVENGHGKEIKGYKYRETDTSLEILTKGDEPELVTLQRKEIKRVKDKLEGHPIRWMDRSKFQNHIRQWVARFEESRSILSEMISQAVEQRNRSGYIGLSKSESIFDGLPFDGNGYRTLRKELGELKILEMERNEMMNQIGPANKFHPRIELPNDIMSQSVVTHRGLLDRILNQLDGVSPGQNSRILQLMEKISGERVLELY